MENDNIPAIAFRKRTLRLGSVKLWGSSDACRFHGNCVQLSRSPFSMLLFTASGQKKHHSNPEKKPLSSTRPITKQLFSPANLDSSSENHPKRVSLIVPL
jgi:hypothetical protein